MNALKKFLLGTALFLMGVSFLFAPAVQAATCTCYFGPYDDCREVYIPDGAAMIVCDSQCIKTFSVNWNNKSDHDSDGDQDDLLKCAEAANAAATAKAAASQNTGTDPIALETLTPELNVEIPGLTFSPARVVDGFVKSGFIGEYISAVYRYLVGIATTIAIVFVMIGGFQYTFGAVSGEQKYKAKKRILNALTGLILLLSSYVILYTVNPDVLLFRQLELETLQPIDFLIIEDKEPYTGPSKPISDTTFDETFKSFANCINVDWRLLKVMAYKESGLNPSVVNKKGFTGLFQTKPPNCADALSGYPQWSAQCSNLTNPHVNTAVGTQMLKSSMRVVKNKCGDKLNAADTMTLLYLGHNSGGGSVSYILDHGGCAGGDAIKKGIIEFWDQHKKGTFKGQGLGEKRYPFARKVGELVLAQGVKSFTDTSNNGSGQCPLERKPSDYP